MAEPRAMRSGWALPARLEGRALAVSRAAWLVVATTMVALTGAGLVRAFRNPMLVALPPLTDLFVDLGLNLRLMLGLALAAPFTMVAAISAIVFHRRSHDPMALLFTITLLGLYAFSSRGLLTFDGVPGLEHATMVVFALATVGLTVLLGLFPDGRFAPPAAGWLLPAALALLVAFPDAGRLLIEVLDGDAEMDGRALALVLGWCGLLVLGLIAQAHRYRRVSGPTERQQTKWVIAPLALVIGVFVVVLTVPALLPATPERWVGWALLAVIPLSILMPAMVANAVLRYRLYEIDRIISRTVSYGLVVVVLAVVYAAGVVGLGSALSALTGQEGSDLGVAVSVLAIVALFRPLRRRVQVAVDRRFNRSGYDARVAVEVFAQDLRDELELETLERRVARVAIAAVEPSRISVWLADVAPPQARAPGAERPRGPQRQPSGSTPPGTSAVGS